MGRKSRQGRRKRFYDAEGQAREVEVVRYYCRNRACSRGSFTHLPPGLVPYSRHRLEVHLLAWQAYAWAGSTYRRVGQALQVSEMTVYRWVSAWGQELLPVAALLGVFEMVYRFTPFSGDARLEIRGKRPLQLAGYDLRHMPKTWLARGYSVDWPITLQADHVPNS